MNIQIQSTIQGKDGTAKTCGPVCKDLSQKQLLIAEKFRAANARRELCVEKAKLDMLANPMYQQIEVDQQAMRERQKANSDRPSILTQYKALQALSKDQSISRATIFIPILLMFLEMVPVLAKTLAGVSTYELLAYQQRQDAIDSVNHAQLEGEATLARKRLFELSNVDLAQHEKDTVAELHRDVHDQVREAFIRKIRERIELWCQTLADGADIQHIESRLSKLFRDRSQCIAECVSAGMHTEFNEGATAKHSARPTSSMDQEQKRSQPVNPSNNSATDSSTDRALPDPVSSSAPPTPQQPSSMPPKKATIGDDVLREYRTSFLRKAVESLASRIPDLVVFLFSSSAAFLAGFPAITIGLASSTGISLIVLFPAVLVAFVAGRMAARNFQRTLPHSRI